MRSIFKILSVICLFLCAVVFSLTILGIYTIPDNITVTKGSGYGVSGFYYTKVLSDDGKVKSVNVNENQNKIEDNYSVEFTLVGLFPVKTAKVTAENRQYVVPSGQSFGIKLYADGVVIVGMDDIAVNSQQINPAKNAGLQIGDIIKEIDGVKVTRNEQVSEIFRESEGKEMTLKIQRKNETIDVGFSLVKSDGGQFQAGLWIRDSSAGVGTMTFYDRQSGVFGGLGHAVNDVDTGEVMPLLDGEAMNAKITGCFKGVGGSAGELCGVFTEQSLGKIVRNGETGIYGVLDNVDSTAAVIPVATKQEIKTGEAQIIATVDENGPQYFDIKIVKLINGENSMKNMIIEVTDERLIEITGGIVQGMSGSPIIQDGMLVGAVTHVFVNDPLQGYGIYAENMLKTANEIENGKQQNAA